MRARGRVPVDRLRGEPLDHRRHDPVRRARGAIIPPMAASSFPPRSFLGLEGPLAIAHRGGAAENPENTMVAFEHAVNLGYRCIETDVQATRDRIPVIFHDESLERLTGLDRPVGTRTWRELAGLRVHGEAPIPKLEDLLGAWDDLRLVIDPKSDDVVAPLIETMKRTGSRDRVCLGSFSSRRIRWLRADAPGCTSCTPAEVVRLRAASYGLPVGTFQAQCAQVPPRQPILGPLSMPVVDAAFVRAAHERGMPVQVWTVDSEPEMHHFLDLGVDAIMTDRVTALKDVFVRRGIWR